jgi:integrase
LKSRTVRLRRDQLRVAAGALVARGHARDSITRLADLVRPDAFKDILRQLLAEHGGQANAWTEGMAKTLVAVAREWVKVSSAELAELRRLMARLPKRPPGLTAKNRETLRSLDDDVTLGAFLDLPQRLFAEAAHVQPSTVRAAVKAQIALAIELLLACPIRPENLIELRLGVHLLRPAGPRGRIYITLDPGEVKNEQRIDFELPDALAAMLDVYLKRFRPLLAPTGDDLFSAKGGQRKAQSTLAQQIQETIDRRLGLQVTPQQFRHIAAKLHLHAEPGAIEQVRQLLGHKSVKTTLSFYAEFDTRRAGLQHDRIIQDRRAALARRTRPRRVPRSKESR